MAKAGRKRKHVRVECDALGIPMRVQRVGRGGLPFFFAAVCGVPWPRMERRGCFEVLRRGHA